MPARISRVRIIDRRNKNSRATDPAQNGAFTARIADPDRLTITGLYGKVVLRQTGVLAAKWEPQADETILLVLREEIEDEPIVVHAFRTRFGGEWETEDAHAKAHLSPDGGHVALEISLPNPAIAVIATGKVARGYDAKANLGAAPESVLWSDDSRLLSVVAAGQSLTWSPGRDRFDKAER